MQPEDDPSSFKALDLSRPIDIGPSVSTVQISEVAVVPNTICSNNSSAHSSHVIIDLLIGPWAEDLIPVE